MGANMKKTLGNNKGMATVEAIPLLIIFIMLVGYGLGLWGYIHSGILYSISARTYAFETFRHRANLTIFREQGSALESLSNVAQHTEQEIRYHAIANPEALSDAQSGGGDREFVGSPRPLSFGRNVATIESTADVHTKKIYDLKPRNQVVEVSPALLMIGYGICINASCGGQ